MFCPKVLFSIALRPHSPCPIQHHPSTLVLVICFFSHLLLCFPVTSVLSLHCQSYYMPKLFQCTGTCFNYKYIIWRFKFIVKFSIHIYSQVIVFIYWPVYFFSQGLPFPWHQKSVRPSSRLSTSLCIPAVACTFRHFLRYTWWNQMFC